MGLRCGFHPMVVTSLESREKQEDSWHSQKGTLHQTNSSFTRGVPDPKNFILCMIFRRAPSGEDMGSLKIHELEVTW